MYSPSTPFSRYLDVEKIKYPELTLDAIETLKKDTKDNCHLPPISEKMYVAFLHSSYFDTELAKKTIEKYYSVHFDIPEVFCNLDPLADELEQFRRCLSVCPMPSSNRNKNDRIVYTQFIDDNPALLECESGFKYMTMWMKFMLLSYGTCDGLIFVTNANGLSWRHVIKLPIATTIKLLSFLELGLPIRWKKLHVLNAGSAAHMMYKLVARFANPQLLEKVIMYPVGSEDIFNEIPRSMLPAEIGGTGKSHNHYHDELYNNMVHNRDIYLEQNELLNNQMMYINQQAFDDNF